MPESMHGNTVSAVGAGGHRSSDWPWLIAAMNLPGPVSLLQALAVVWRLRSSFLPFQPHTCQPLAQTSAGEVQTVLLSSPQALPVGLSRRLLVPSQVARQPAIRLWRVRSAKPSRWPSAQPTIAGSPFSLSTNLTPCRERGGSLPDGSSYPPTLGPGPQVQAASSASTPSMVVRRCENREESMGRRGYASFRPAGRGRRPAGEGRRSAQSGALTGALSRADRAARAARRRPRARPAPSSA